VADMLFSTCRPPVSLHGAVRELWLLDDDGSLHAGLPKPFVEIVVSLSGVHWWRASLGSQEHCYSEGWVTPIQRGPRHARSVGRRRLIGARLQPWAAVALFGALPAGNGTPPPHLSWFIGGEAVRLRSRLICANDDADCFAKFAQWLEQQAPLGDVAKAVHGGPVIETRALGLARKLHTSPRTLRRRFAAEAGISPKRWLMLQRIDAVLRDQALLEPCEPLAAIAHQHGYADQAHFSREVSRLTGATPGQLRKRPRGGPPHLLPGE